MRIAVLSDQFPPNDPGGAQEIARRTALAYLEAGHDVKVLCSRATTDPGHGTVDGLEVTGIPVPFGVGTLEGGFANPATTRTVLDFLDSHDIEVVHAHNIHSALGWAWIAPAVGDGRRVVLTFHDHMAFTRGKFVPPPGVRPGDPCRHTVLDEILRYRFSSFPRRASRIRQASAAAAVRTAVSADLARRLGEHGIADVRAVLNGIDDEGPDPVDPDPDPRFVFLGRPTAEKGIDVLVETASRLERPVSLVLTGDIGGERRRRLEEVKGPQVTLEFTGWVGPDDRRRLIDGCLAVVNLSTYPDPFNLTNLEGLIRARPVIGTTWGGTPEVVPESCGWLVDPRHADRVVEVLGQVLADPAEATARGRRGRRHVLDNFLWKDRLQPYLEIVSGLTG